MFVWKGSLAGDAFTIQVNNLMDFHMENGTYVDEDVMTQWIMSSTSLPKEITQAMVAESVQNMFGSGDNYECGDFETSEDLKSDMNARHYRKMKQKKQDRRMVSSVMDCIAEEDSETQKHVLGLAMDQVCHIAPKTEATTNEKLDAIQ